MSDSRTDTGTEKRKGADGSHAVLIAGGGPTGLMLAGELALAGIDVAIVERRRDQHVDGSRAGGLHARTIECLDQRGIAERFLKAGRTAQVASFAWMPLDISDFPTRHPYGLALWQKDMEPLLAAWVEECAVPVYRGLSVQSFTEDPQGLDVRLDDGRTLRAAYLVGCDGGRSIVRREAGIDFPGWPPTISNLIAEAQFTEDAPFGLRRDETGIHGLSKLEDGRHVRIMLTDEDPNQRSNPDLDDLKRGLIRVFGSEFGVHSPVWISRFTDQARQAAAYRKGRVLLAGDAAHIHYPVGGQGLNIGLQDAVNLGWKLGLVLRGLAPESLLDSYHAERHPVAARVLRDTMAQVELLRRSDDRVNALREIVADLVRLDGPRRQLGGMMSGLDIRYDLGDGHPLLGRRMPDLDLETKQGTIRVFALLHEARPLLIRFAGAEDGPPASLHPSVKVIEARHADTWDLPVIGAVAAPTAVLVRPDGYVAWVDHEGGTPIEPVLDTWFGAEKMGETPQKPRRKAPVQPDRE